MNANVVFAESTEDAVERLAAAGADGAPLAGATWIMRRRSDLPYQPHPIMPTRMGRFWAKPSP